MKKTLKPGAAQRAMSGLLTAALIVTGAGVVSATPAFAETKQCYAPPTPPANKDGVGTFTIANAGDQNFQPGGTVRITGKDIPVRPEGGWIGVKLDLSKVEGVEWKEDAQPEGVYTIDASGTRTPGTGRDVAIPVSFFQDGNLDITLTLPEGIPDGKHLLTIASGKDGNTPGGFYSMEFQVFAEGSNPADCQYPAAKAAVSISKVSGYAVDDRKGSKAGQIVAEVSASGLTPNSPLEVKIAEQKIDIEQKLMSDDAGNFKGKITLPKGVAPAGPHKFTISDGDKAASTRLTTDVYATIDHAGAQGSTAKVNITNLPATAKVTGVGVGDTYWWTGVETPSNEADVEILNVAIPADAEFGAPIVVSYLLNGEIQTVDTNVTVGASVSPLNMGDYSISSLNLKDGLYQSAINNETGMLFATRANRTKYSTLYKINTKTMEVELEKEITDTDSKGILAAYGIAVDNKRKLVWVTNTRQDAVAVYNQDTLELVKQWESGISELEHPRDVVVDEDSGIAYVSASAKNKNAGIYAFNLEDGSAVEIPMAADKEAFPRAMTMAYDKANGVIYTVAREKAILAKVDLKNGNTVTHYELPADKIDTPSGVALDTKHNKLYVTGQTSGTTLVIDANDLGNQDSIKEIRTGAGALHAAYNPVDGRVYVAQRDASTVVAIDTETDEIAARFDNGVWFNHITVGEDGTVYALDKASQNPNSGFDVDHLIAYKLKRTQDGSSIGGGSNDKGDVKPGNKGDGSSDKKDDGSSDKKDDGKAGIPDWATALLSITGVAAFFGLLAAALPMIAQHLGINLAQFGIKLPF